MTTPYPVPAATEEPLGSVTRILSLSAGDGEDVFSGGSLPQLSGRVYGGQVVAQGMLAAAATVEDDGDGERLPHSVHAFFHAGQGQPDHADHLSPSSACTTGGPSPNGAPPPPRRARRS